MVSGVKRAGFSPNDNQNLVGPSPPSFLKSGIFFKNDLNAYLRVATDILIDTQKWGCTRTYLKLHEIFS